MRPLELLGVIGGPLAVAWETSAVSGSRYNYNYSSASIMIMPTMITVVIVVVHIIIITTIDIASTIAIVCCNECLMLTMMVNK